MTRYYYAVKDGRKTGIYKSWEECEAQVKGYSGALYKKFSTYEEALKFISGGESTYQVGNIEKPDTDEMIAYVDGSFEEGSNHYSYGAVIFTAEGKATHSQKENDTDMVDMRNVAGEIRGAMYAMDEAVKRGKKVLYLYYDYMGIEKWALGEWKTNRLGTKRYKEYYDRISKDLKVIFIKVKAHSGVKYNEEADRLAKEALG
ncbi:MAG TPA: RNase H [Tepidimicrobium sp.]|nr:RNase H [Tepidimicrobium sp.]